MHITNNRVCHIQKHSWMFSQNKLIFQFQNTKATQEMPATWPVTFGEESNDLIPPLIRV